MLRSSSSCPTDRGVERRGGGSGGHAPVKSGVKKGQFFHSFGLSAIKQYFLVTLLPAQSNFTCAGNEITLSNNHLLFRKKMNFGKFQ